MQVKFKKGKKWESYHAVTGMTIPEISSLVTMRTLISATFIMDKNIEQACILVTRDDFPKAVKR